MMFLARKRDIRWEGSILDTVLSVDNEVDDDDNNMDNVQGSHVRVVHLFVCVLLFISGNSAMHWAKR